jgi:cytoskeletal protein CcmA (bactofilin family)
MRRKRKVIGLLVALLLLFTGVVSAQEIIRGEQCDIPSGKTITGNVFVLCRTLNVAGTVDGSLFGVATSVTITGEITGDTYLLAGQLDVAGTLGDDLHFAGLVLRIHSGTAFPNANSDLVSATLSTTLDGGVSLPGSLTNRGYQVEIDGSVSGEVDFWGSALAINGEVGKDVDATVGDPSAEAGWLVQTPLSVAKVPLVPGGLHVGRDAHIAGQLQYTGPSEGAIDGTLDHPAIFTSDVTTTSLTLGEENSSQNFQRYVGEIVREFFTLSVIGVIGLLFTPRLIQAPIQQLRVRPLTSIGVGIPAFFLPLAVAFMIAVLTLLIMFLLYVIFQLTDLALIGGIVVSLLNVSFTGLYYFVAIFIARVVVCLALGRVATRLAIGGDGSGRLIYLSLFVGVAILAIVGSLPFPVGPFTLGGIVNAIVLALGLGAILILLQDRLRILRETPTTGRANGQPSVTMLPPRAEEARAIPPPILDDVPQPPGMDNLPPGFKWWDD